MNKSTEKIAFPNIEFEKELKTSSNSRVCLVRDKENRTRYIYRSFTGGGEVYRKMQGITCPYLPRIYDIVEDGGHVFVLEEYIQGDTLAFLLDGNPLTEPQAKQIITQICKALNSLHGIGAVHRDIKPENIIIRGSDAVLIDFDASRICNDTNTNDTRIMGTTGYAAPEQYGFSQTDARADIYALGILFNEMITKQHPSKLLADGQFRPIIEKCTKINVDQRYSSAAELLSELEKPPLAQKHMGRRILLALTAVMLLFCGIVLMRGFPKEAEPKEAEPQAAEIQAAEIQITEEPDVPEEPQSLPEKPLVASTESGSFVREKLEISMEPWEGATDGHATPFEYDIDGDGETENYLFGVDYIDSPHKDIVYYDINIYCLPGVPHRRDVHPCVWRLNEDGTPELAMEFSKLLSDAYVRIWRVDDFDTPEPEAWTKDYFWPGCVSVTTNPVHDSTWLYEVGAYLGELHLTASATSSYFYE